MLTVGHPSVLGYSPRIFCQRSCHANHRESQFRNPAPRYKSSQIQQFLHFIYSPPRSFHRRRCVPANRRSLFVLSSRKTPRQHPSQNVDPMEYSQRSGLGHRIPNLYELGSHSDYIFHYVTPHPHLRCRRIRTVIFCVPI